MLGKWEVSFRGKQPSGSSVIKQNGKWIVQLSNQHEVDADTGYVRRSLLHMSRLVADSSFQVPKSEWDKFGVGDTGTEIRIYTKGGGEKRLIVGRLDFLRSSISHYFVRIPGDETIYIVNKYLNGSMAAPEFNIRSKIVVNVPIENIYAIHILSANGQPVNLQAEQTGWTVNTLPAEMNKVGEYVNFLMQIKPTAYAHRPVKGADYSIIVNGKGQAETVLKFYRLDDGYVMESSANEGNFMLIPSALFGMLFPGEEYFQTKK
jgi:hypothetical protein